ncbi:hypothetical protein KHQ82_01915 [Mycoplasmatota bacterium]|nr:hypothetical protein KHQ82_01915 [Mycoplasmatota bacterium]
MLYTETICSILFIESIIFVRDYKVNSFDDWELEKKQLLILYESGGRFMKDIKVILISLCVILLVMFLIVGTIVILYGNTPGRIPIDDVIEITVFDDVTNCPSTIDVLYHKIEVVDADELFEYIGNLKFPLNLTEQRSGELGRGCVYKITMKLEDGHTLMFSPLWGDDLLYMNSRLKGRTYFEAEYEEGEYNRIVKMLIEKDK